MFGVWEPLCNVWEPWQAMGAGLPLAYTKFNPAKGSNLLLRTKHRFPYSKYNTVILFLLTVILTDVRQPCGPKCLINVSYSPLVSVRKSDSRRPDVALMLPTR